MIIYRSPRRSWRRTKENTIDFKLMGIQVNEVTNFGESRSVVKYGSQPNDRGPSGNGFDVLVHHAKAKPGWHVGDLADPLVIETKMRRRYRWVIADVNGKLQVFVSRDGSKLILAGAIKIQHASSAAFDVWIYGDHVVIENGKGQLVWEAKKRSFKYFKVDWEQTIPSDDFHHFNK